MKMYAIRKLIMFELLVVGFELLDARNETYHHQGK